MNVTIYSIYIRIFCFSFSECDVNIYNVGVCICVISENFLCNFMCSCLPPYSSYFSLFVFFCLLFCFCFWRSSVCVSVLLCALFVQIYLFIFCCFSCSCCIYVIILCLKPVHDFCYLHNSIHFLSPSLALCRTSTHALTYYKCFWFLLEQFFFVFPFLGFNMFFFLLFPLCMHLIRKMCVCLFVCLLASYSSSSSLCFNTSQYA